MTRPHQSDEWAGRGLLDEARMEGDEAAMSPGRRAKVWSSVHDETVGPDRRTGDGLRVAGLALAAACVLAIVLWADGTTAPTESPVAPGPSVAERTLRFGDRAIARLALEAEAIVAPAPRGDRVLLRRGRVAVEVTPGKYSSADRFAVEAGDYTVRVLGTVFEVDLDPSGAVEVSVQRGLVEVTGPGMQATQVGRGRCWSSVLRVVRACPAELTAQDPAPIEPTVPTAVEAPATPKRASRSVPTAVRAPALAEEEAEADAPLAELPVADPYQQADDLLRAGKFGDAAALFAQVAESDHPQADVALYELARARERRLGDAEGAMKALLSYQSRFPSGVHRPEVDISLVQLLVSRGLDDLALIKSEAFLVDHPDSPRHDEVRRMRGDTFRSAERFLDALAEYDEVGPGKYAESAAWRAAACLADAGMKTQARARLNQYLEQFPKGPHAAEAKAALSNSAPKDDR